MVICNIRKVYMTKEDEIAIFVQDIRDMRSCLRLIQIAARNEFEQPSLEDINSMLEIIITKYDNLIDQTEKIFM